MGGESGQRSLWALVVPREIGSIFPFGQFYYSTVSPFVKGVLKKIFTFCFVFTIFQQSNYRLIMLTRAKIKSLRLSPLFVRKDGNGEIIIINSKKAKPRFCLFPSICRKAFAGKVKPRDFVICVPLNHRAARKTPNAKRRTALVRLFRWGCP